MKYSGQVVIALLFIVVAGAFIFFRGESSVDPEAKHNVHQRVIRSGKLRCAYIVWPPEFMMDPNSGEFSGIDYDIIRELARRLDVKIEWVEEVNFGSMITGLEMDRYDMVCFASYRQSGRARRADFTIPVFYSGTGVFVRAEDRRFDAGDLSAFNDPSVTVSTMDGEMAESIAREQFPKARNFSVPQNSDFASLLLNVVNGKADVTFANKISARKFQQNNPGLIRDISADNPIRVFSHGYVIKKGETAWGNTLDLIIQEMHDHGFIERTLDKYGDYQDVIMPVARPY